MSIEREKAQLMSVLAKSKGCWGAKYDRLERFKRFQNLKVILKDLSNVGWLIIHKKPNYTGISLNTKFKKEIVEFIEREMPELRGVVR